MSAKSKDYSASKLGLEVQDTRKAFYAGWDAAMAQSQGEPKLKREKCPDCDGSGEMETGIGMFPCDSCGGSCVKYSLTVQPQGEWVDLTDSEILEAGYNSGDPEGLTEFARRVIAKFKSKNTPPSA